MAILPILLIATAAVTSAFPTTDPSWRHSAPLHGTIDIRSIPLYRRNATPATAVAGAGLELNPAAAAKANQRDDTATRAFSNATIKTSSGKCLFVDPVAGDFRENLIPVQLKACDGGANEQFDIITKGKHNDQPGSMLVVSTATQGCLNFDPRRPAGDQVIMFSCGGRADGDGSVVDSQLFKFTAGKASPAAITLAPNNAQGNTCLLPAGANLDAAACDSKNADQIFTVG